MVKKSVQKKADPQYLVALRVTRTSFFFVLLYLVTTIVFDSGNLLTNEAVGQRWTAASLLLIATTLSWYILKSTKKYVYPTIVFLTVIQICFIAVQLYWERGMAATSTLLLALPLLTIASLRNRTSLLATAALTATASSLAAVKYFNDYFNEGYRIQLWGTILFYSGLTFIISWLIMNLVGLRHDSE